MSTVVPMRRLAARLALFAVLFQAILFGWHHHDLRFARHLPAAIVENPTASPQIADDADGCEICQVLHHQTAAAADAAAVLPPHAVALTLAAGETAFVTCRLALGFHARGPPLV